MHKFIPSLILTLLISLFLISTHGAPVKKAPLKVSIDTSKIVVKQFDANAIKKYKADKDFNYTGEAVGQPSFWERFWNWLWDKILSLFGRVPYFGSIFKYLLL